MIINGRSSKAGKVGIRICRQNKMRERSTCRHTEELIATVRRERENGKENKESVSFVYLSTSIYLFFLFSLSVLFYSDFFCVSGKF
jgi:hypothetical protein